MEILLFGLGLIAISFGCGILVVQTFAYGVVMELKGQHAGMGATLSKGFSRFFPVLGVAILLAMVANVQLRRAAMRRWKGRRT